MRNFHSSDYEQTIAKTPAASPTSRRLHLVPTIHTCQGKRLAWIFAAYTAPDEPITIEWMSRPLASLGSPSGRVPDHLEAREEDGCIDVPIPVLRSFGWSRLVASAHIDPGDVRTLLQEVAAESCAHSWRTCNPQWDAALLAAWENQRRPTEIIGYYGLRPGGTRQLVGVATIAHSIHREFPYTGFPVLARAFIRPGYRGRGLYGRLLEHRLSFCRRRWGSALKAIHMGSLEPRVWRVIARARPGWPRFVHVGDEELVIRGQPHVVRDFVMFTPGFGRSLLAAAGAPDREAPEPVRALRDCLARMLRAETGGHHFHRVSGAYERACAGTDWFTRHDCAPIEQFLALCRAIPLTAAGASRCAAPAGH
jgi:GNAT superfamily N-acetyltransferase